MAAAEAAHSRPARVPLCSAATAAARGRGGGGGGRAEGRRQTDQTLYPAAALKRGLTNWARAPGHGSTVVSEMRGDVMKMDRKVRRLHRFTC